MSAQTEAIRGSGRRERGMLVLMRKAMACLSSNGEVKWWTMEGVVCTLLLVSMEGLSFLEGKW